MSVSAVSTNQYSYLDQQSEGGGHLSYTAAAKNSDGSPVDAEASNEIAMFGEDGFGFDDFLDIINPLQHLPIISNIYREITGDELSPGSRIIGGGIFGGGIGLAASVVNTAIEAETGKDIGGHVLALFNEEGTPDGTDTVLTAEIKGPVPAAAPAAIVQSIPSVAPAALQKASLATGSAEVAKTANVPLTMGLQWKNKAPDLQKNIEQARALHENNLTPEQMSKVLGSFKIGATSAPAAPTPLAPTPAPANHPSTVSSVYEKQISNQPAPVVSHNSQFDYLDRVV